MNYNFLFLWIAFMALVAKSGVSYLTTENGYEQIQVTKIFAYIVFIPIIYFVCTAPYKYWGDYYGYIQEYRNYPVALSDAVQYIMGKKDCYLFHIFTYIVKVISGGNVFQYRLALAIVQTLPLIGLFRRYSTKYTFTVYLFLATATPIAWMLNGVRQLVAAAIIYAATPYIIGKKYIKTFIIILIASLFHQTAILMVPIVYIAYGEAWNWKTNLSIVGMIALTFLFARSSTASETLVTYAGYDVVYATVDDGVHPLRVLVSFIPVFMAFLGREDIEKENSLSINLFVNMSIFTFGVNLIAMVTSGILVGRFPLYTTFYSYLLLPYLFELDFNRKIKSIVMFGAIAGYGLFYFLQYGSL